MKPEAAIKAKCALWLKKHSDIIYSCAYPATYGAGGFADRLGYIKRREGRVDDKLLLPYSVVPPAIPFVIEYKAPGKELTLRQESFKRKMEEMGVPILAPCTSLDELRVFIDGLINIR